MLLLVSVKFFSLIFCLTLLSLAQEGEEGGTFFPFPQAGEKKREDAERVSGEEVPEEPNFFSLIPALPRELEVTNDPDTGVTEGDFQKEELRYRNNVVIKADSGLQIYADEAVISLKEKRVSARGNVSVYNGPYLFRGEQVVYYYEEKRLDTTTLRTGLDPFLMEARTMKNVERDGRQVLVAEDAAVTTDDYENPSYWIKADKVSLFPDDTIVLKNMKVQVGETTIFWLPYLAQSLDPDLGYHFSPGGQSNLGFFWKNRYGWHVGGEEDEVTGRRNNPDYLMQLLIDPYTSRGVGLGAELYDLEYEDDKELGSYSLYWIYDRDPEIKRSLTERVGLVENSRYKIGVQDRRELGEIFHGELRLDTNLTLLSDAFFLEDFFEGDFRRVPQPDNVVFLSHKGEKHLWNLTTRFQLNDFYQTDTRLPELSYDRVRSPLWGTGLFYETHSSAGFLRERLADEEEEALRNEATTASEARLDEIQERLDDEGFFRAHTWHEFSYPLKTESGFSLTPRAGAGYTFYDTASGDNAAGGVGSDGRFFYNLGVDASFKLSKSYPELINERLGLKGLNHVVQPYLNLSVLEVSELEGGIIPVDRLTPITRPRPVNVGRFVGIDELDDFSVLRAGIRQSFITQRNGRPHQWLYWDTYLDFLLGEQDAANSLSNLYNEISWNPLPWMRIDLETQFPVADSPNDFTEVALGADFLLGRSTEVSLGYGLLENHPILRDSNNLRFQVFHRLNEEWGLGMEHRWQFDDGTLEFQKYAVHRNLKSWVFSAEVFRRDFRVEEEWGFSLGLTLRDFPEISLPISVEQ